MNPMRASDEPRRTRGVGTWLLALVGGLVTVALILGGFYVWRVWTALDQVERSDTLMPTGEGRPSPESAVAGSLNVVLMGSDARSDDERGRSDVLMLAHVSPARDQVYIVSFPRDLWVTIPDRGEAKINAAYSWGGEPLAIRTIESLIGVRVDHAAKIDFDGFVGLTTALDGVTVNNRVASTSGGYSWPKGQVTIKGEEALTFVRQRYELPGGDLDRAERQRAVVKAILTELMSANVIANPLTFNEVVGELGRYFTVDSELTNEALFQIATSMRVTSSGDIRLLQVPISGFSRTADGQSIDLVDQAQFGALAEAIRNGTMAEYYDKYKDQPFSRR